ncbi:hypothetical protein H7F37_09025 [Winogradskyella sp. PAMC22761]|nr:hypothetical protein H7F37_09025 [Winogradskyella sp. PAMC22761]
MKKLAIIALVLVTLTGYAQKKDRKNMDKENRSELREDISPKDMAELKAKRLTLKLDLTDAQQAKVQKVILKQAEENQKLREEKKADKSEEKQKPTKEEMVERQNYRLDQMIEMKREMKTILTAEQYAEFEKMKPEQKRKKGQQKGKYSRK